MRFVIFIDALDPNDLNPWFEQYVTHIYNPGIPKVTPNVVSQIMTGKNQENLKFMRSTPFNQPRTIHIEDKTILHYATDKN